MLITWGKHNVWKVACCNKIVHCRAVTAGKLYLLNNDVLILFLESVLVFAERLLLGRRAENTYLNSYFALRVLLLLFERIGAADEQRCDHNDREQNSCELFHNTIHSFKVNALQPCNP